MSGDSFADAAAAHEYQAVCQARDDAGQPERAMRKPEYERRYRQSEPTNGMEGNRLEVRVDQSPHEITAIGEFLDDRHDDNGTRDSAHDPQYAQLGRRHRHL